jgi:DNA (cytosine-5)-methyltransferase 1
LHSNITAKTVPGIERWQVYPEDVRGLRFREFGSLDLIAGGAPCQPFSIGGKHRGMDDSRNMIPEFVRAVRETKPKAFILENVRGLVRPQFRTYFAYILLQLTFPDVRRKKDQDWVQHHRALEDVKTSGKYDGLKFNVVWRVVNAADYGVPRSDTRIQWHFPAPTHSLDALLRDKWLTGDYWRRHDVKRVPASSREDRARIASAASINTRASRPWVTLRDALSDLPEPRADRRSRSALNHRIQPGARSYVGHTGSLWDMPSKTLKAGDHGVPGGENTILFPNGRFRYLTVREAARVQSFPDTWMFEGAWSEIMRQLGNALPMRLARIVAESVSAELIRYKRAGS